MAINLTSSSVRHPPSVYFVSNLSLYWFHTLYPTLSKIAFYITGYNPNTLLAFPFNLYYFSKSSFHYALKSLYSDTYCIFGLIVTSSWIDANLFLLVVIQAVLALLIDDKLD